MRGTLPVLALCAAALFGCPPSGEEDLRKGNVYFKNGLYDEATEAYTRARVAAPDLATPVEGLANVEFERKSFERAIELYREAIEIAPKSLGARHHLAVALSTTGRVKEAMEVLGEAIAIEPKNAFAHHALGGLHRKQGDLQKAEQSQLAALDADEDYHAARYALAILLVDSKRYEEAERELTRLVRANQTALGEYGFARLNAAQKDYAAAGRHLARVLEVGVEHPEKILSDPVFVDAFRDPALAAIHEKLRAAIAKSTTSTTAATPD